jgi:hypothetical protein
MRKTFIIAFLVLWSGVAQSNGASTANPLVTATTNTSWGGWTATGVGASYEMSMTKYVTQCFWNGTTRLTRNRAAADALTETYWNYWPLTQTFLVNVGGDPDSGALQASDQDYALEITGDYVISSGVDYAHAVVSNVDITGDHVTLQDCSATFSFLNNININSGSDNVLIDNVESAYAIGHGIGIFSNATNNTDNDIIRNCLIHGNGIAPNTLGEGQGIMVYTYDATHRICNLIIEDNTIYGNGYDNHDHGIYDEGYNTHVRRNLIYNHPGFNIKIENGRGGSDCRAYDNVLLRTSGNNAGGIHLTDSTAGSPFLTNNLILHNTIINCGNASPTAMIWYYLQNATTDAPSGNLIMNNTLYNVTNGMFGLLCSAGVGTNSGQGLTTDYNNFYLANPGGGIWYSYWGGAAKASLALHQAASGQDANSISSRPYFVNESLKNFHIRSYSAGVDLGASLRSYRDCVGPCDIGAYEYEPH